MMLRMLCGAIAAGVMFGLGGCSHGKYIELRRASANELKERSTEELLWAAGIAASRNARDDTLIDELAIRLDWPEEARDKIKKSVVSQGFTREMLVAARGHPGAHSTKHVGWYGKRETISYGDTYFHVDNGIVTGWTKF